VAAAASTAASLLLLQPVRGRVGRDRTVTGGQSPPHAALVQSRCMPTMTLESGQPFPALADILRVGANVRPETINRGGLEQP
jgi:hypothetical protein